MIDLIQWRICIGCYYGNRHCCHGNKASPAGRQHQNVLSILLLLGNNIILTDTVIMIHCLNYRVSCCEYVDFDQLRYIYLSCSVEETATSININCQPKSVTE